MLRARTGSCGFESLLFLIGERIACHRSTNRYAAFETAGIRCHIVRPEYINWTPHNHSPGETKSYAMPLFPFSFNNPCT